MKYPWGVSLGGRKDTRATKLLRGKTLFLSL